MSQTRRRLEMGTECQRRGAAGARLLRLVGVAGVLAGMPGAAGHGQTLAPTHHRGGAAIAATRAERPPRIDGADDDPVWHEAERRSDFRTFAPREDEAPALRTELRVAYDDRALYVHVRAYDPRPDSIVRLLARRDTDGPPNDQIQLFIDSFHDRRGGYEYIVNAAGVKSDYLLFDDSGFDQSWDGVWDVATRVDSLGWSAEYAIPLGQVRFRDRDAPLFGIMVWRLVGRTGERTSWPLYRPSRAGLVSQAGTLTGARALARSASLQATPYVMARTRNDGSPRSDVAVGGDVRLLPRPSVSVEATINPDFGQLEGDPAVLDLSGFEVFQVERRPFFLEGAGQLGLPLTTDGSALLFHSRRIGRAPALGHLADVEGVPTETTILGAARLTARVAPTTSVTLLSAATNREEATLRATGMRTVAEPRAHYGVGRVQHDFRDGRSGVGLMFTRVDREAGDSASVAALPRLAQAAALTTQHQTRDGSHSLSAWVATSDVRGSTSAIGALQRSTVHGLQQPDAAMRHDSTRTTLHGTAGQLFAGKVAGGVTRYDVAYRWISPGFDVNEVGYLTIAGVRGVVAHAGLRASRPGAVLGVPYRSATVTLGFVGDWTTAGLPLERGLSLAGMVQLPSQAQIQGTIAQQLPGAFCTMTCTRGGPALVDPPRSTITLAVTGDPRRRIMPRAILEWYRDDEGRSRGASGDAEVRWRARTNLDLSLAALVSDERHDAFFHRWLSDPLADSARPLFARLDQPSRSLTARLDYTATPAISMQWYAEAYLSRGAYTDVRELGDPRAGRYEARFVPYPDDASEPVEVDLRRFRSNAVARWEFRPGSTLFVVWTQERVLDGAASGAPRVGPDLRALFARRPSNVIAVKMAYWMNR